MTPTTVGDSLKLSIALILKGYPRLSETFIAQEIRALEQRGIEILIVSLRHPTDPAVHPIHEEIQAKVLYLPEYLHNEPLRLLRALWAALYKRKFIATARLWLRDLGRDFSFNRIRRFGQALVLVNELPPQVTRFYAHFIHTPGSVTRYSAELTGLPWSASAHAKDIWTIPQWEIREKLAHLEWLSTCTRVNAEYLQSLTDKPEKVELVYHGLDFERFPAADKSLVTKRKRGDIRIISVGRAVAKKGYHFLLEALAMLPQELNWSMTHIGGGTELSRLKSLAGELNLSDRIHWLGPQPQKRVLEYYRNSDLFVLPCQVIDDGDRDGLPNVLMEAQSQRLCCISSDISGIPELIEDDVTGALVPQRDSHSLANTLKVLMTDEKKRVAMAEAGYQRVTRHFSMDKGIDQLIARFTSSPVSADD